MISFACFVLSIWLLLPVPEFTLCMKLRFILQRSEQCTSLERGIEGVGSVETLKPHTL